MNLKTFAAATAAAKLATRKIQMFARDERSMIVMPTATAGLNAPPEIAADREGPGHHGEADRQAENGLPPVPFAVATLSTT